MIPFNDLAGNYESIKAEIDQALWEVIRSAHFIKGPQVAAFETAFAEFCGVRHCVGAASGTAALHLALRGLGVGAGDEVVTSPMTFIATSEAVGHAGARVVFADIDEETYTLAPEKAAAALTARTRAILPVHLYGQAADMAPLLEVAARAGAFVVEDAAQAHGARYRGTMVGALGHAACFSFFPGKNLGAFGDAGAVTCREPSVSESLRLLADHGRREKYLHVVEGFNYRLDTLQAAVLSVKLKYLARWNAARQAIARMYDAGLQGLPLVTPRVREEGAHVFHLYVVQTEERDRLREYLGRRNIASQIHYPIPLHRQPAYEHLGYRDGAFPVAEALARRGLSLPIFPQMPHADVWQVVAAVREFYGSPG